MNKISEFLKSLQSEQNSSKSLVLTLLLPIISLIATPLLAIFIIYPQSTSYLKTYNDIAQLHDKTDELSQKAKLLQNISLQNFQGQLDIAIKALPVEKDFITTTSQLQTLTKQSQASLTNISFGDAGTPEGYQVKVDAIGTYDAINNFLQKIERAPRIMKITSLEISPDRLGQFSVTASLIAYYMPITSNIGKVDQKISELSPQDEELVNKLTQTFNSFPGTFNIPSSGANTKGRADPFE